MQSDRAGILTLSELYFPHWEVTVDGRPAELLRVNYAFRGVALKPGSHLVEMQYRSPWIRMGLWVSFASLLILAVGLAGYRSMTNPKAVLHQPSPSRAAT